MRNKALKILSSSDEQELKAIIKTNKKILKERTSDKEVGRIFEKFKEDSIRELKKDYPNYN